MNDNDLKNKKEVKKLLALIPVVGPLFVLSQIITVLPSTLSSPPNLSSPNLWSAILVTMVAGWF